MKRKMYAVTLVVLLFLCFSFTCSAMESSANDVKAEEIQGDEQITPYATSGYTVTDKDNNRYRVTGTVLKSGMIGQANTTFRVSYYGGGGTVQDQAKVNGYIKACNVAADVWLQGGGTDNFSGILYKSGASGECYKAESYLYTVNIISGFHEFGCNDKIKRFNSME